MGDFETAFHGKDLLFLTLPFQEGEPSLEASTEIAAAVIRSLVTEPGDRFAGALCRILGTRDWVERLITGFDRNSLVTALKQLGTFVELQESYVDLEATIQESRERWLPRLSRKALEETLQSCAALKLQLVQAQTKEWPEGLNDLGDSAPGLLYLEGNRTGIMELESGISIVGSRKASSYGKQVTFGLISNFAPSISRTVSGGAIGIDQYCHMASVENSIPTVAVMAGGLARKYPRENYDLFNSIRNLGAIVSELPPNSAPTRWRFLQRNRLIAAMTPTTIVVEAGFRSGSIRTANDAIDLDRRIFAVPGSIFSSNSVGTNQLIADGKAASLLNLKYLEEPPEKLTGSEKRESDLAKRAKDAVRDAGALTASEIAIQAGLSALELSIALRELQRDDQLICLPGGGQFRQYALKYGRQS
jgi:DNA processing protein